MLCRELRYMLFLIGLLILAQFLDCALNQLQVKF